MQSFAEAWIQEGIEKGRQQEAASFALRLLHRRFGILEAETQEHIRALPLERLEEIPDILFDFDSRDEFAAWLHRPANDEAL